MMTTTLRLWLALRLVSPVFSSPRVSSAHTLLRLVPSTRSRSFAGNGLGFFGRNPKGSSSRPPASTCRDVSACGKIAVLFDFDGTIGDTEVCAMEVCYWELAPYFIDADPQALEGPMKADWIRENCGKPFGEMIDALDEKRKVAGLSSVAEMRKNKEEDPKVMDVVDSVRQKIGLKPISEIRAAGEEMADLWDQSRGEIEQALAVLARPCKNVPEVLEELTEENIPFSIATTSPKPRVPISVDTSGLRGFFPPNKIHSGESDFDPPRFKPDPSVYLKAAEAEGVNPANCVAVEDSASGVGSAANAGIGMIIGYVGASHIPHSDKDEHGRMLIDGKKSDDLRGADVVLWNMRDAIPLINAFRERIRTGEEGPHVGMFFDEDFNKIESKYMLNGSMKKPRLSEKWDPLPATYVG
ncbi:hypothetical protein AAMO2058_000488700 [Amorphochlora amoebiformis]